MVTTALLLLALLAWFPRPPIPVLTGFHQVRHLVVPLALPLGLLALTPAPAPEVVDTVGDLRIVTLNAGDHRSDVDRIVDYVQGVDADIVCLQEVTPAHIEAFDRSLNEEYPYRSYQGGGINGLALLSKFPIESAEELRATGPLTHQQATLDVNGRELRIINAHPSASIAALGERSTSAADVRKIAELATVGTPTIVMGDFNSTDQTHAYHALESAGLQDAFRTVQGTLGPTFPVRWRYLYLPLPPIVRIDFHWHTHHFAAVESRVGRDASSDHLPLESTLSWRRDAAEVPQSRAA